MNILKDKEFLQQKAHLQTIEEDHAFTVKPGEILNKLLKKCTTDFSATTNVLIDGQLHHVGYIREFNPAKSTTMQLRNVWPRYNTAEKHLTVIWSEANLPPILLEVLTPPKNPVAHRLLFANPNTREFVDTLQAWDQQEDRSYLLHYLTPIEPCAEQLLTLKQFPKINSNSLSTVGLITALALYLGAPTIQNHQLALALCHRWESNPSG